MKYFVPRLRLGALLPKQIEYRDKLGGHPWGLPKAKWPRCKQCRHPLGFLAQFAHDPERLDLGGPGRVLFLFSCDVEPGMCDNWSPGSGSTAAIVLTAKTMTAGLTAPPSSSTPVEPECVVTGWKQRNESLARKPKFERDGIYFHTKLGGAPFWIQSADVLPRPKCRFLLQLSGEHYLEGKRPTKKELGIVPPEETDWTPFKRWSRSQPGTGGVPSQLFTKDGKWGCATANCAGGLAYVFMRENGTCIMFIQN